MSHERYPDPARDPHRLAGLMEDAPVFLAILAGPEHPFVSANRQYRALLGARDLIGKSMREAMPEAAHQGFFELLDGIYATGTPFIGTALPIMLARGEGEALEEIYVSFVYQPTRDEAGAIDGILATGYEVTEQVRARTAAQAAADTAEAERAYLATVLEQFPIGVIIAAVPTGTIRHYNARAEAILGHPLIPVDDPADYAEYGTIHPDGSPCQPAEHPLVRAVTGGETIREEETLYRRGDGQIITLNVNVVPVRDADGTVTTAVAAFSDLTPLKELEQTRETFLAAIAHDLKTPLTTIRGLAQLLQRGVEHGRPPRRADTRRAPGADRRRDRAGERPGRGATGPRARARRAGAGDGTATERSGGDRAAYRRGAADGGRAVTSGIRRHGIAGAVRSATPGTCGGQSRRERA